MKNKENVDSRKIWIRLCLPLLCLSLILLSACGGGDDASDTEDGDEATEPDGDADREMDAKETSDGDFSENDVTDGDEPESELEPETEIDASPTNEALVFPINPVATPDPVNVELRVADDSSGVLVSPEDENGLRRLAAYTCLDEGATNTINVGQGPEEQRICTLVQRANKETNGDFIYDDYTRAVSGVFDADDIHAEVEAFYHADKFYEFFTRPEVGVFNEIPNRHGDDNAAISLVANFQQPVDSSSNALAPMNMAMYFPKENLSVGMAAIYGLEGLPGDVIILGQGNKADFAYDGETVYHEMGHLMNRALVHLSYTISVDAYGMSSLENALEQGLAETMTFLVSGKSGLFDYIDTHAGPGFFRDADNELVYPDDFRGIDQADAMITAGAMWDAFEILKNAGLDDIALTRLLLLSMQSLDASTADLTLADWANAFTTIMEDEGHGAHRAAIETVFEERGLLTEERARPLEAGAEGLLLNLRGTYPATWNRVLTLETADGDLPVATAFVQLKAGPFDTARDCTLTATQRIPAGSGGMTPVLDDWDVRLLVRADAPVTYTLSGFWRATVEADGQLLPNPTRDGNLQFTIPFPKDGRVYIHPVNAAYSPLFLSNIRLTCP